MSRDELLFDSLPGGTEMEPVDMQIVVQLRRGDADAGRRFFREQYPAIYRYLFWLTDSPETAEDLAQETFLRAWRHINRFDGRAPLRAWLHRIAHREFLRHLRSRRPQVLPNEVEEVAEPPAADFTDAVDLRAVIRQLPVEQREAVVLHYLHGYECREIAHIVGAPVGTVKYRLSAARTHLQRQLGEDDLGFLNEPSVPMRQWAWLPLDRMYALETRLVTSDGRDRQAPKPGASQEKVMERREFLRQATAGAVGLMLSDAEKDVVDSRLARKVTLAFKGAALADVCAHLRAETGVHLTAGPSVADEKVTLFCRAAPLRDVMRQLSRPFGYTWSRGGEEGRYRYELEQDLRSQLLEEELRTRDRHAALLVLEREMEQYRPYLGLSPNEAWERAKTAPPEERPRLDQLMRYGWGPVQMYFRLRPNDLAALHTGQQLKFSAEPKPGERLLPLDLAPGVLQGFRDVRLFKREGILRRAFWTAAAHDYPDALPPESVPEARASVTIWIRQSELGQFEFDGTSGIFAVGPSRDIGSNWKAAIQPIAAGMSPTALHPKNRVVNAKLAHDPDLRRPISVRPQPSGHPAPAVPAIVQRPRLGPLAAPLPAATAPLRVGVTGEVPAGKATTADVLEALHQATGMNLVADFYTRLYRPEEVSVQDLPVFEALNALGDAMRLRWGKQDEWLQFRSVTFYDDRLKEVPSRLLKKWAASRQQHGRLSLDDLIEIAQLSDAQLDAAGMAEGARDCWGLEEWDLGRSPSWRLRPHLRFLASFTSAQRQQLTSATGLSLQQMTLAQQQQFIALALEHDDQPLQSLAELEGAALRVDYSVPGEYEWSPPGLWGFDRAVPVGAGKRALRPPSRGETRDEALKAARRIDPAVLAAMLEEVRKLKPAIDAEQMAPQASQIVPTPLDLTVVYMPSASLGRPLYSISASDDFPVRISG